MRSIIAGLRSRLFRLAGVPVLSLRGLAWALLLLWLGSSAERELAAQQPASGAISGQVVDVFDPPHFTPRVLMPRPHGAAPKLWAADLDGDGLPEIVQHLVSRHLDIITRDGKVYRIEMPGGLVIGIAPMTPGGPPQILLSRASNGSIFGARFAAPSNGSPPALDFSEPLKLKLISQPRLAAWQPAVGDEPAELLLLSGDLFNVAAVRHLSERVLPRFQESGLRKFSQSRTTAAFGDPDGDGRLDLFTGWGRGSSESVAVTGLAAESKQFAGLPEKMRSAEFVPMDLNGDHRADLLVWTAIPSPLGWFAVYSQGRTGVEVAIEAPVPDCIDRGSLAAVDYNQDGFEDLIGICRGDPGPVGHDELWLMERNPPHGISGVQVSGGGVNAVTDGAGRFRLDPAPAAPVKLSFAKPGYLFAPAEPLAVPGGPPLVVAAEDQAREPGRTEGIIGDPPGPYVCIGYVQRELSPLTRNSATPFVDQEIVRWAPVVSDCPSGYAIMNIGKTALRWYRSAARPWAGNCCRLPAGDILRGEPFTAGDRCPENAIVTGFEPITADGTIDPRVRCTHINTDRYQLSEPFPGVFWGFSFGMRGESHRIPAGRIPPALRWGFGRNTWNGSTTSGCIGGVNGGLLIDARGSGCEDHRFAELEYRSDNVALRPVPMFPVCDAIKDPYNPLMGCGSPSETPAAAASASSP